MEIKMSASLQEYNSNIFDMALTSDEKIIAIGDFYYWDTFGNSQEFIVRINPDGSRDTSFNIGTSFSPVRTAEALEIQSDGKIILGGNFNSYSGNTSPKIVRLNSNGTYDNSFVTGTGFNGRVTDLTILSDGSVIVVGDFTSYNGTFDVNRIAKLDSNGAIDLVFKNNVGTGVISPPRVVKEIPSVGLLIGGVFSSFNGTPAGGVVCLNSDGSKCSVVDFGVGAVNGIDAGEINDFSFLNSSTLLVVGAFTLFNSVNAKNLAVLNLNGSVSNQFTNYKGIDQSINRALVQADGKVILGGDFYLYDPIQVNKLVKFKVDKTLDEEFLAATANLENINSVSDVVIDSNNKILIGGSISSIGSYLASHIMKLNSDGSLDSSCVSAMGTGFNFFVQSFNTQNDGKVIVNGGFSSYNGSPVNKVLRLDTVCNMDSSFQANLGIVGSVNKTYVLSDGKFLHVGSLSSYDSTAVSKVVRVQANGTLDGTYPNSAAKPTVKASYLDASDRLYISSNGGTFNGTAVGYLSRISPDGTVDVSFNIGTGFDRPPSVIKVIDGKVYAGGEFTSFNSTSRKYFIILNEDGSENTTVEKPEALFPVRDIIFNSATGKIEFAYIDPVPGA